MTNRISISEYILTCRFAKVSKCGIHVFGRIYNIIHLTNNALTRSLFDHSNFDLWLHSSIARRYNLKSSYSLSYLICIECLSKSAHFREFLFFDFFGDSQWRRSENFQITFSPDPPIRFASKIDWNVHRSMSNMSIEYWANWTTPSGEKVILVIEFKPRYS